MFAVPHGSFYKLIPDGKVRKFRQNFPAGFRGNIPTWLSSQSALIRDWLGFHQVGKADVRAFRGALAQPLKLERTLNITW